MDTTSAPPANTQKHKLSRKAKHRLIVGCTCGAILGGGIGGVCASLLHAYASIDYSKLITPDLYQTPISRLADFDATERVGVEVKFSNHNGYSDLSFIPNNIINQSFFGSLLYPYNYWSYNIEKVTIPSISDPNVLAALEISLSVTTIPTEGGQLHYKYDPNLSNRIPARSDFDVTFSAQLSIGWFNNTYIKCISEPVKMRFSN